MPKDLYLTLVNGRTIHVTDDWDGLPPTYEGTVDAAGAPDDGEGIEAGEYYRDIFRSSIQFATESGTGNKISGQSVIPGTGTMAAELNIGFTIGPAEADVTINDESDEHAHAKPRTWQKVCTWLVFNCVTSGQKRKWRAASVDGYSDQPPIDD